MSTVTQIGPEVVNDRFVEIAKDRGFYSEDLMAEIKDRTSIQDIDEISDDVNVKHLFHTAHDVPAELSYLTVDVDPGSHWVKTEP